MAFLNRANDRLQAALQGGPAEESLRPDVEVVKALREIRLGQKAYRPDPAFVALLAERLLTQQPVLQTRPLYTAAGRHRYPAGLAPTRGPVVSIVHNTVPRVAASMGASAFVVGAVLGVSSRASMPGQTLYPVSNLIDVAAVTLAGSDQSRGETLLSQAERHIGQAEELASIARRPGSSASADDVQAALQGALDTAMKARQTLEDDFALRGDPSSLVALQDFTTRVTPAILGLVGSVPDTARSLVGQLQTTVTQIGIVASTGLTACPACQPVVALTDQQLASVSTAPPSGGSASSGTGPWVGDSSASVGTTSGGATAAGPPVSGGTGLGTTTGSTGTSVNPPAVSSDPSVPQGGGGAKTPTGASGQPAGALDGTAGSSDPVASTGTRSAGGSTTPAPPVTAPAPPVTAPAPPVTAPAPPVTAPAPPVTAPAPPVTAPAPPVTAPAPPVTAPAPPVTAPAPPVTAPAPPVTAPAPPVTAPAPPVTTPAPPVTTPAPPVTTPAPPVTAPAPPVTAPAPPVTAPAPPDSGQAVSTTAPADAGAGSHDVNPVGSARPQRGQVSRHRGFEHQPKHAPKHESGRGPGQGA